MNSFLQWLLIVVLILLSGLFSGLTLGLMGLDMTGLEIVMGGSDPKAAKNAKKIRPIRKNGNQLLCTLLLGNVAVNALLSILTAELFGGLSGFLMSTAIIVIFGEIIPQASCSRYALQIGAKSIPVVKVIMVLMFPLSYPMAWCLDKALGEEMGTIHSKAEMKRLLEIHVRAGGLDEEEGKTMAGALQYQDKVVEEVMTPLEDVFMVSIDDKLTFDLVAEIFKSGFSRIPVYEVNEDSIVGLLLVKDLIFVDPEDEVLVRSFIQIFGRGLHVVWPDQSLGECLRTFKQGRGHMALVRDVVNEGGMDPRYVVKGIITLEDIIEEILGAEIVDETDVFVDVDNHIKVDRRTFDWARLRLLDSRAVDKTLGADEVKAASAHLLTNHKDVFGKLTENQLHTLLKTTPVVEVDPDELRPEVKSGGRSEVVIDGVSMHRESVLYERGVKATHSTLVLGGRVIVLAGKDRFRADAGAWKVLGTDALMSDDYEPDFTAFVNGEMRNTEGKSGANKCRMLKIDRKQFAVAMAASVIEGISKVEGGGDDDVKGKSSRSIRNMKKRTGREKALDSISKYHSSADEGDSEGGGEVIKPRKRKSKDTGGTSGGEAESEGEGGEKILSKVQERLASQKVEVGGGEDKKKNKRASKRSSVGEKSSTKGQQDEGKGTADMTGQEGGFKGRGGNGKSVSFIESGRNIDLGDIMRESEESEGGENEEEGDGLV
ncbi:hypothetical protein TrCOL_g2899 [Triparma columacea]|uniref:CNNM transmembrane domain-containing protein n=1 Tax=Triparma columacea TaxID=722753 RepID=A0A9W7GE44_9STRA|nr:hypothetical protein TrCOL_g2899 [Triparma columacea]